MRISDWSSDVCSSDLASSFALMDFGRDEGKTLACCATVEEDVTIEADIDEDPDAEIIPIRDFAGRVTRIESLTPTIKGLWIDLGEAIHFQAGQYINLALPGSIGKRALSNASALTRGQVIDLHITLYPRGPWTVHFPQK